MRNVIFSISLVVIAACLIFLLTGCVALYQTGYWTNGVHNQEARQNRITGQVEHEMNKWGAWKDVDPKDCPDCKFVPDK
jgi:hypothetical protein